MKTLEEILETTIATFMRGRFTVGSGCQNCEVNSSVKEDRGNEQTKILESGLITVKVLSEGLKKEGIKHPNFGGPSPQSTLNRVFFGLFLRSYTTVFPRVV